MDPRVRGREEKWVESESEREGHRGRQREREKKEREGNIDVRENVEPATLQYMGQHPNQLTHTGQV